MNLFEGIGKFVDGVKNFLGDTWDLITDVVDFIRTIYDLIVEWIGFIPPTFRGLTLLAAAIVFAITIWRLKK